MKVACFAFASIVAPTSGFFMSKPTFRRSSQLKLWEDDEEMIDVAEHYLRAKYKASAKSHGHDECNKGDAVEVLRSVLPPVTKDELSDEVRKTLAQIMKNPDDEEEKISEDDFVAAVAKNSYWENAGDLVVKELMYFDALYNYYQGGASLLNDDDYGELKENLTWEGSSVPTMKAKEALFVTAVASSRRGEPLLSDEEYAKVKADLKAEGSWVTDREQDALEKLGLDTFMGYLHRSLK